MNNKNIQNNNNNTKNSGDRQDKLELVEFKNNPANPTSFEVNSNNVPLDFSVGISTTYAGITSTKTSDSGVWVKCVRLVERGEVLELIRERWFAIGIYKDTKRFTVKGSNFK